MPQAMDYTKVNKLAYKSTDYTIDSEVTLNLGRSFERNDNFFGVSTLKQEDSIANRKIVAIGTNKKNGHIDILFSDGSVITLSTDTNPLTDKGTIFKDKLWSQPGIIAKFASQQEVQDSREYSLTAMEPVEYTDEQVVDIYNATDNLDLRKFLMERVGDDEKSEAESTGKRVFPTGINQPWLRSRFMETGSFLGEVFAFPDELTKEAFLSAWLVRGGSCLLSGVPGTGKSIVGTEPVLVKDGDTIKNVKIGEFIDDILSDLGEPSNLTDIGVLTKRYEVLSLNKNNKISWQPLSGISRHRFDGELIKVKTRLGRTITATPNHSFLRMIRGKLSVNNGEDLKIGDILPSMKKLTINNKNAGLWSETVLPSSEFLYGSKVKEAIKNPKLIANLPITQYTINNYINGHRPMPDEEMVYIHNHKRMGIPEFLYLDYSMGCIIGAYIAEGSITGTSLSIHNNDKEFKDALISCIPKWCNYNKASFNGSDYLSIINGTFTEFIKRSCSHRAENKKIPDFVWTAPTEFVKGLLRFYFDGDGYVESDGISALTKSEQLAGDIVLLLSRFDITSNIHEKTLRSGPYKGNIYYIVHIPSKFVETFNRKIGFGLTRKRKVAKKLASKKNYNSTDMIINFGDLLEDTTKDCGLSRRDTHVKRATDRQRLGRSLAKRYLNMFKARNPESLNVKKWEALVDSDVIWDEVASIEKIPFSGYVYDFEVKGSPTRSFIAGRGGIVIHNTVLTELATLLFMNAYGFANLEYRAPIQDIIRGETPKFIYKDLNHIGVEKANILTVPPDDEQLSKKGRRWAIVDNIPTTNQTHITSLEPTQKNIDAFIANHRLTEDEEKEARGVLKAGKILIGKYEGHTLSQKYSRNRVAQNYTDWESERFDQNLLKQTGGILENRYYSKSLLRKGEMGTEYNKTTGEDEDLPAEYVSDVTYDRAKYPDTDQLVKWVVEVSDELEYLKNSDTLIKLVDDVRLGRITNDDEKTKAKSRASEIRAMKSHIHKMWDLEQNDWEKAFRAGRAGIIAEDELKDIHKQYGELFARLEYLTHSILHKEQIDYDINVFNARSNDEILNEMKMDMGITTCSENKSPEEILYTTEISLVEDTDAVGRPIQQYIFKPSPLDFVTKPGKFLNEFTRADKDFQDQLLSLLDRRLVEHRGERFKSPPFILFADNNPHKLLTAQIDWALWDRIDIELFLKGAKLGTKDMVLTRKFGREDLRSGKTKIKMNFEEELLERISKATTALNHPAISATFRDDGTILKPKGELTQGIMPMRFRELQMIWNYVDTVTIPKRILHTVYLLTATMNQSWYLKKDEVNKSGEQAKTIQLPGTELIPQDFKPYMKTLAPREKILDYSVLAFATDFMQYSVDISNYEPDKAKDQFPLGVTRPVGIRFVISLLKFAKALAWLRRGHTEVTEKEVYDLFPLVGSHRLNIMPFGEERIAGVDDTIKRLYPNIQDFLRFGILDTFWKPRAKEYLDFYDDIEARIDAGNLNVDDFKKGFKEEDVIVQDIRNGVEFVKRNAPEYKRHLNLRLNQVRTIGSLNYYSDFLDKTKKFIRKNDEGVLLFNNDVDELDGIMDDFAKVFDVNYHQVPMVNADMKPGILKDIAIPVLEGYKTHIDTTVGGEYKGLSDLSDTIDNLKGIYDVFILIQDIEAEGDIPAMVGKIKPMLEAIRGKSVTASSVESMQKDEVLQELNNHIKAININEKYSLETQGYTTSGGKPLRGELLVTFDDVNRNITLTAKTMNEHLLWQFIRYADPYTPRDVLTDKEEMR